MYRRLKFLGLLRLTARVIDRCEIVARRFSQLTIAGTCFEPIV
jgi:hypothetical protein